MKRYLLLAAMVVFFAGTAQAQNILLNPPDAQGQLGQCTYAGTYYSPYAFTPTTATRGYTASSAPCIIAAPGRVGHSSSYTISDYFGGCEWQVVIEFDLQGLAGVTQNNFQSATLKGLEHFGYFDHNPLVGGSNPSPNGAAPPQPAEFIVPTMDVDLYDLCDVEESGSPTPNDFDCTLGSAITTFNIPEGPFGPSQQGDCNDTMVLPDVNVTTQIFHDLFDGGQDPSWAGFLLKEPGMVQEGSSLKKEVRTRGSGGNDYLVTLFDLDTPTLEITTEEPSEEPPDFGDAPDPTYPTLLASNGAQHVILPGFHLGAVIDAEADGQPNATATGDDSNGNDDEDGVIFTTSQVQDQSAFVTVTASAVGRLDAWIDFDGDGIWQHPGERIFASQLLAAGPNVLSFPVPAAAALGNTFARFRFSSQGELTPTGAAPDGEVEDYRVTIEEEVVAQGLDFGDAPDPTYPTLLPNGARHVIVQGLNLGVKIDGEPNGQPDLSALGDDSGADLADDEDGVVFTTPLLRTQTADVTVIAFIASGDGLLDAWIDFNANGVWEAGEQIFTNESLVAGVNALSFPVPAAAALGDTFARFRFSSQGGLAPTGGAPDGEVEDYRVTIGDPIPPQSPDIDYGDAPDPTYPTLFASDGARHLMDGVLFLGASVDRELDGQPNAAATGDDTSSNDDEDGVIFTTALDLGFVARVTVIASAPGFLDAWIDFDGDGVWQHPGEQIVASQALAAGLNVLSFPVPAGAALGNTFSRFRFSSLGDLTPTGQASDGEVEDYQVSITIRQTLPPHEGIDTDGDGIPDNEEDACNSNLDRIPDRIQCNVASFKTSRGQCVTLEMPVTQGLTQICFQEVQNRRALLPLPPNPPSWVSLPFGLLTFKIVNLGVGNCTTVTFHSSGAPQGQVPQTYWKYGPTPSIPFPHWYDFSFNGRTGAEFIDEKTIVLHFCDGERGDSDLTANGEILDPGGPSHIGERRELYFPYVTNLGGGFNVDDPALAGANMTDIGIVNKAPYDVAGEITFYQEDGAVATDTKTIPSSPTNPFPGVETIEGVLPFTVPGNGKLTILPEQFPSSAASAIVIADGDVVGYAQFTGPAGKRYAAPATTLLTSIMTAPFLRISEATGEGWRTGFGIFNPGDGAVIVQFQDDTLAGVPEEFTLDPKASRFLWVENPEEGVRNIQATGAIAAVEVFEYLPATSETDMAAILLGNRNASDLCVPAILFGAGEGTSIGVGNPPGSGSATVNALGYNAALNETMVELGTLPAGEMKSAYLTTSFPPDTLWARITGDVVQALGSYFVDQQNQPAAPADAEKIATVNLNNLKFRDGCFGIALSAAGTPTFALVNPGLADADVIAFAYDNDGAPVASSGGTVTIAAQMTFGLTDLFGAADLAGATSIRIVSIESEEELCGLEVVPVDTRWQGLPILQ